ncbi:MAG TPA: hypothetical protein VMH22_01715 [bacterium]|nr:hypothetical protein [bacterium]
MNMSLGRVTIAAVLALAVATSAIGQTPEATNSHAAPWVAYAAETGGSYLGAALLGGTVAAAVLLPFYTDNPPETKTEPAVMLGIAGALGLVGCSGGTWLVGSAFDQHGQFLSALGGATAVSLVGVGVYAGGVGLQHNYSPVPFHVGEVMKYIGAGLLVSAPVAAVLGYNHSRPADGYSSRFIPGSVALGAARDASGVVHPSLDVKLLSVRF